VSLFIDTNCGFTIEFSLAIIKNYKFRYKITVSLNYFRSLGLQGKSNG